MIQWEYCILSRVETSIKRRMTLTLTFSSGARENRDMEIALYPESSEQLFISRFLGQLGTEGWELVALNRAAARFEAVMKRRLGFTQAEGRVDTFRQFSVS